jgi:arylsulfatase A-like enzyme
LSEGKAAAVKVLLALVAVVLCHVQAEPGGGLYTKTVADTAPPNVVVILADDLSTSTLADTLAHGWMPNLQSGVIDQGMTFTNHFVTDSLCSPSRATFLTGQHAHNHGVRTNVLPAGGVTKLDDSSTLATWLQAAGYRTGHVGKYLNGYGSDTDPSPKDDPTYLPPGWDDWQAITTPDRMFDYTVNDNGSLVSYGSAAADYQTDVLATRALDFITDAEQNDAQPFLLVVATQAPHQEVGFLCGLNVGVIAPLPPAPRHAGMTDALPLPMSPSLNELNVTDKPAWVKAFPLLTLPQKQCLRTAHRNRVGSMLAVDDLVGALTTQLQDLGELGDTVVVFTSDNGFLLGEHRLNSKQQAYEEAVRVPLYVRAPGMLGAQVAQQLVANVDLAPTLAELAGATPGLVMDGRSFAPILQDPGFGPWRTTLLIEHEKVGGRLVPPSYAAVRSSQHLWVEYSTEDRELYDLAADPFQLVSQHANPSYAAVRAQLRQALGVLSACVGAGCWL